MPMKYVAAALLASSLLSAPALAQSAQQPAGSNATTAQKIKMQQLGTWRTSKLIGLNVYNSNNEKIGNINELINEASGKLDIVVIGVGGFLGIGESNVGLPWNQVKFVMEPRPGGGSRMELGSLVAVDWGGDIWRLTWTKTASRARLNRPRAK
jgi:sporulation protein YlmC with PRC-barrel domain